VAEKEPDVESNPVKAKSKKLSDSLVQNITGKKSNSTAREFEAFDDFDLITEERQEPVKISKVKAKKKKGSTTNKPFSLFTLVAFVLSSVALVGVYFNYSSSNSFASEVSETLDSNSSLVGSLSTRLDELTADAAKYKRATETNALDIAVLNELEPKVEAIDVAISEIKQDFVALGKDMKAHGAKIQENNDRIKSIQESLRVRSKPVTRKARAVAKPKTSKVYQLEDATLVSIDTWGSSVNAVLRAEGGWVPLSIGEMYRGWRFVGSQNNKAHFEKGKKSVKLSIKE
jgi:hypothetical protein